MKIPKILTVKQMLKKYKCAKVYLFKNSFVIVDPNVYYSCRVKGNRSIRCPQHSSVYNFKGNLFVGNYVSKEHAEEVVKSWNSLGSEKYEVGPVAPFVYKKKGVLRIYELKDIYPEGAGIYQVLNNEND